MRYTPDHGVDEVLPSEFNVRTRAHEYGGGAFAIDSESLVFSHFNDNRIYLAQSDSPPLALSPDNRDRRYADFQIDDRRARVICVVEDHHDASTHPENRLVSIDINRPGNAGEPLAAGYDFYASPCLDHAGKQLAWLCWNFPNMPWDGCELWVGDLDADGRLSQSRCVAGGQTESIFQPRWSAAGGLYFVSDRSGWWNLYCLDDHGTLPLVPVAAEFGLPQWLFGMSTYAFTAEDRIVCCYSQAGTWHLATLESDGGSYTEIETPYTDISDLQASDGDVVFFGGSPTQAQSLVKLNLTTGAQAVIQSSADSDFDQRVISSPESLNFPSEGKETIHAFFYPPCNPEYEAPPSARPPLLVKSHGGPTAATSNQLNLKIQYWTSRGFAVLDVNYRGSTGFGRRYRNLLYGNWGMADVADCVAGARYLVAQGRVAADGLTISGGSAGGYTTLCALTFHDLFRAGASYYGISDLESLARDTHKFEAHYLDYLLGPYPAKRQVYHDRSPVHFTAQLSCPIIFFQGKDDRVVPPAQAEGMVQVLRDKGLAVAYVLYPGEQHGFRQATTIRHALESEYYFYSRVFGFTPSSEISAIEIENI